jgi:hypothetical protein
MNKGIIDKQIARAQEDVKANAEALPPIPAAEEDEELKIQLAAVKGGYIKRAYRSRNGALVVVR